MSRRFLLYVYLSRLQLADIVLVVLIISILAKGSINHQAERKINREWPLGRGRDRPERDALALWG